MERKPRKTGIFEKTSETLDIPGDIAAGIFRVTATGYRKVHIENHRGILEYGDETIRVNCGRTIVKISGKELEVKTISKSELLITGDVDVLSFEK